MTEQEYMRLCLVRYIKRMKTRSEQVNFLTLWGKKHGAESAEKLKKEVMNYRGNLNERIKI